jgi:hypothetical protein
MPSTPLIVLTLAPILAGLGIVACYQVGISRLPSTPSAERLFQELCQAHRINRRDARLLRRMSQMLEQTEPASLFLLRQRFDSAAELLMETENHSKTATSIAAIRSRLFDDGAG